jgi:hypothetical protein
MAEAPMITMLMAVPARIVQNRWAPPRLVTIPALLVLAGLGSVVLFGELEQLQRRWLLYRRFPLADEMATQRTRLLASFAAINFFFWFADPTLGLAGGIGGQVVRSLVLVVSAAWLARSWRRSPDLYRRESLSVSLRRQLEPLVPQLQEALDGRSLEQLTPTEVFTLAKVLPVHLRQNNLAIYRNVLNDLFSTGRLDRASSFLQLEELRSVLGLKDEDHHEAVRELALRDPALLQLDASQRQARDLREAAATEAVADLLDAGLGAGGGIEALTPRQRQRLERIRQQSGLEDGAWAQVLGAFAPASEQASPLIARDLELLEHLIASRDCLLLALPGDPLLAPLLVALDLQMVSVVVDLLPALDAAGQDLALSRWHRLGSRVPSTVTARLAMRGLAMPEATPPATEAADDTPSTVEAPALPLPTLDGVLQELWQDPDPATAAWALWRLRRRNPEMAALVWRQPRLGLPSIERMGVLLDPAESADGAKRHLEDQLLQVLREDRMAGQRNPAALLEQVIASLS